MNTPVPSTVQANAWTGSAALEGPNIDAEEEWGLKGRIFVPRPSTKHLLPEATPDARNWSHPKVGWGLVLADDDALSDADKAVGEDVPQLKKLMTARKNAPILRYRPGSMNAYLRRYFADGRQPSDLEVAASRFGVGDDEIPTYLLIYGSPEKIPWRAQYALNMSRCVGRLDLDGVELENYVEHLIREWAGVGCNPLAPVVWSVNFGEADITWLMQQVVAEALRKKFGADPDGDFAEAVYLIDQGATGAALAEATSARPGLVVTTSHGYTGPENAPEPPGSQLGLLVDADHALLSADVLPAQAVPGGAIWYAHACCSAGSDAESQCADLFPVGHPIGDTLRSVSKNAGNSVAPLVRRLLGAPTPVRAFVGHVEPTFDWTLRDPYTGQAVGDSFATAFYDRLYQRGTPLGLALGSIFFEAGAFLTTWRQALADVNKNVPGAAAVATYRQVAALDRQSVVILGDPTVSLPL